MRPKGRYKSHCIQKPSGPGKNADEQKYIKTVFCGQPHCKKDEKVPPRPISQKQVGGTDTQKLDAMAKGEGRHWLRWRYPGY